MRREREGKWHPSPPHPHSSETSDAGGWTIPSPATSVKKCQAPFQVLDSFTNTSFYVCVSLFMIFCHILVVHLKGP